MTAIQAFRHGGDVAAAICVALALLEASRFNEYPFIKEREK